MVAVISNREVSVVISAPQPVPPQIQFADIWIPPLVQSLASTSRSPFFDRFKEREFGLHFFG